MKTKYVYHSPPIAEFAPFIAQALLEDRRQSALRLFIQINDNLQACAPEQKIEMATDEPPLTGHAGYDALLAGLVEYHFIRSRLPLPKWVLESTRSLQSPWYFEEHPLDKEFIQISTPECFAHRNVFIRESELMSV